MITVLIVENDSLALEALAGRLAADFDFKLAKSADEMRARLAEGTYDVVVLDLGLGSINGVTLLPELKELGVSVLVLSGDSNPSTIKACQMLGASGYIVKGHQKIDICGAVREVSQGRTFFPKGSAHFDRPKLDKILNSLTGQERKALDFLILGLSYKKIAICMEIEANTARNYGAKVISKFGAGNRMKLPYKALSLGYYTTAKIPDHVLDDDSDDD